ncbi:MAG: DNA-directed RNA polymerase subunit beta', partial [Bacteroidales bacterium]|nr:DNA-directed RNA polymerase subunit beta' [Bacteroidales bacterium]
LDETGKPVKKMVETTMGRILFNNLVPQEVGYINCIITKKSLRDIIARVQKACGIPRTADFLDDVKNMGYRMAFVAGLSFNLSDVIIPKEKEALIKKGYEDVEDVMNNYNMGFITNNERYNQIIDIWTHVNTDLTGILMKQLSSDQQGFNSVYMMLDSGARGSKDQIRQLCGMRGLMAKPQKSGAEGPQIIENPVIANLKEGLSVQEYFISSHGARKGLSDTALKTADAGYLTRRLVDVSNDVIITDEDCGTLRGLTCTAIKNNDDVIATLYERILGRVAVNDVIHPITNEVLVHAGEEINEAKAKAIEESPIESVEIRSVLTCESRKGVCAKCYGRNLATSRLVHKGEAVGVIAAQSIGEPGTQLTLRTFHQGGVAGGDSSESSVKSKYDGIVEIDELRSVPYTDANGRDYEVVVSRLAELRIVDKNTGHDLIRHQLHYASKLFVKPGQEVKKGDDLCEWDPYNAQIITEKSGVVKFDNMEEGVTYKLESDEQTGFSEMVIIESHDKTRSPSLNIMDGDEIIKTYNLPVGAHVSTEDGMEIKAGETIAKMPRAVGKAGDITGGLPRVTELFEARNPSNPAVVSEIDGEVSYGKIKRGNREIIITSKTGERKIYLVSLSKQILVQENDYVRAGTPLSDGAITPTDILTILGPTKVQEYIVNEVQDVYRLQGVAINDKHFEVIVRQMMRKVEIQDPGDTTFLEKEAVDKIDFQEENDRLWGMLVVTDAGDSDTLKPGQIITARRLRDENSQLRRRDMSNLVQVRDAVPATANQILQGITRAALQTKSFMSAASFQETTKVLNESAIQGKVDFLEGLKENVICGHLIPAGTGTRGLGDDIVGNKEDLQVLDAQEA